MTTNPEPNLHVGIVLSSILWFELKGKFECNNQEVKEGIYQASISRNKVQTSFAKQKIIEIKPLSDASRLIIKNVKIGIGFHWEQEEDQVFEGGLVLFIEESKVRAVNVVPLERYLTSVVSSEMSAMNDLTLLKTHAIVSRSWLMAQILNKQNKKNRIGITTGKSDHDEATTTIIKWYDREDHARFDVCADDHCQRYQGITKIISDKAQKAVHETRGMVLMYNGRVCDARFSKCCGGITEDFKNVWQPIRVPYLSSVYDTSNASGFKEQVNIEQFILSRPEAFCNTSDPEVLREVLIDFDQKTTDFFRWTAHYTQSEISELIFKKSGINFGKITDLVPLERGKSGRIIRLKIIGHLQTAIVGKELEIRKWLSETHLYSSAFVVEKQFGNDPNVPAAFTLRGAGWGHGVGMCQIGAAVMSRNGYSYAEIIGHYFRLSTLEKRY